MSIMEEISVSNNKMSAVVTINHKEKFKTQDSTRYKKIY